MTTEASMRRFVRGYRYGGGAAVAVVRPGSLLELWECLKACVDAGAVIVMQAANTGLTGGSTPDGEDYGHPVVIINAMRMAVLHLLGSGHQVLAGPGTTLDQLEKFLKPIGREPHSVIGSSCLGASVVGGVCNNSGGSLIKRGPAYTELALFARLNANGELELVNHLDLDLGTTPEDILGRLDRGDIGTDTHDGTRKASDHEYQTHVRNIASSLPARYNGDTRRLFETAGSSGKVIVFAVRLDTFEAEKAPRVFYVGTNDPDELARIRRDALSTFSELPVAAEYIHREAFEVAEAYGKDTFLLVKHLGTARLPFLFALKGRLDSVAERIGLAKGFSDRLLQKVASVFPQHLPKRLTDFRDRFEHHLMIKAAGNAAAETEALLQSIFPSRDGDYFACSPDEGSAAFLHRFAAAGAAIRYALVNDKETGGLVALDIALPRNARSWRESLDDSLDARMVKKLYYGHFFCHVFHQDYVLRQGEDWLEVEHVLLDGLDERGAKYPAEHNFGHLYEAPLEVARHYRSLDPCNCLNPGVGQTSKRRFWAEVVQDKKLDA